MLRFIQVVNYMQFSIIRKVSFVHSTWYEYPWNINDVLSSDLASFGNSRLAGSLHEK